jgi:hypothetical protein
MVSLTMNPLVKAKSRDKALFSNYGESSSILVASARGRAANASEARRGRYVICAFAHITATYTITVNEVSGS